MSLPQRKMKFRSFTIKYLIPVCLILYTAIMVLIQLGIPDKKLLLENLDRSFPSDFRMLKNPKEYHANKLQGKQNLIQFQNSDLRENSESHASSGICNKENSFVKVGNISVFSVYLDNRLSTVPKLRIIALKQFLSEETLICHFKNKNRWLTVIADQYEMCENHGRYYGGWIYSCKVPQIFHVSTSNRLSSVYLSSTFFLYDKTKFKILTKTSVFDNSQIKTASKPKTHPPIMQQQKKNFGLCLPPLFGDISLSLLIQFVELSKILGASHLTFYKHNISNSVEKILNYYQKRGDVTLVKWNLPPEISEREIWYHGQILAIQDCLYRNMAKFEYLIFVDIDEFIIPRNDMTWTEMLNSITDFNHQSNSDKTKSDMIVGYSFKSAFFDPKQMPDTAQQLTFLQLLQRNAIYSSLRTKIMVRPDAVFEMGIHHVSKLMDSNLTVLDIDPDIAIIHHYRPCIINYEPSMKCHKSVKDESILKYEEILVEKYKEIVRKTVELFVPKSKIRST